MAGYNKFNDFVEQLGLAIHNLSTHTLKVALARATDPPTAADTILSNITQPTGTGYAPIDTLNSWAEASGTGTLTGTKAVFTASAGDWLTFQYVILYNEDATSPFDALMAWWEYLSPLQLANVETFSVKFNSTDTTGTIFTLA